MNTLNTITVQKDRFTFAIDKLELLHWEDGRPILDYLAQHLNASLLEIILETGLETTLVEDYIEALFHNGFVWKEPSSAPIRYTLNQPYLNKVTTIAKTLAGFWK